MKPLLALVLGDCTGIGMSDAELAAKFRQCAARGRAPPERTDRILERLWDLESLRDVNDLMALLRDDHSPGGRRPARAATHA